MSEARKHKLEFINRVNDSDRARLTKAPTKVPLSDYRFFRREFSRSGHRRESCVTWEGKRRKTRQTRYRTRLCVSARGNCFFRARTHTCAHSGIIKRAAVGLVNKFFPASRSQCISEKCYSIMSARENAFVRRAPRVYKISSLILFRNKLLLPIFFPPK